MNLYLILNPFIKWLGLVSQLGEFYKASVADVYLVYDQIIHLLCSSAAFLR
jgi:hypothetical protein